MEFPPEAERRIATEQVAWLTSVTDGGAPAPNPVWFVRHGDDLIVFAEPSSRKVHNIEQRPLVSLHFNSDAHGGDIVVINGPAEVAQNQPPSATPGYVDKYEAAITGEPSFRHDGNPAMPVVQEGAPRARRSRPAT